MKLLLAGLVLVLIVETNAQWYKFPVEAAQGAWDMGQAYVDMIRAGTIGADKYFHARGNYEAAQRGAGGKWAAKVISDVREWSNFQLSGEGDTEEDQKANRWGREGGDPNVYRPSTLDDKY